MTRIARRTHADTNHDVVLAVGGRGQYRRQPCGGCPWRVDQTGEFPAEAFRISAPTAYDLSDRMFGCHESGSVNPSTCAEVTDGGHELHRSYRAMAVANGVPADDPVLADCRDPEFAEPCGCTPHRECDKHDLQADDVFKRSQDRSD